MRRYWPWLLGLIWLAAPAVGALELPETGLAYEIEVSFDPAEQLLDGAETIRWTNPSATSTVDRVPLHLYLNAFANDQSTWMRTTLGRMVDSEELSRKFDNPWGYNEPRTIRQGGTDLVWAPIAPDDGNPLDRSLIEVMLAEPVGPGETLTLEIEFDARLPVPFARTGGFEDFFLVAQWFPKLAMYETVGVRGATEDRWNAHQFHGRTEFYAEYADFDVRIGLPPGWAVAATGQGGVEREGDDRVWHRYRQRAVHDFAFATGSGMVDVVTTHQPAGVGGPVEIHVFLPAYSEAQAPRWRRAATGSLDVLGARVGPYPYPTLTVVMPPFRQTETWGMEYPTLFTGLAGDPLWDVPLIAGMRVNEQTIAHEFCHEYFYGLIGTNEFEEAFLDEGFTEFWGNEVIRDTYGDDAHELLGRKITVSGMERLGAPGRDSKIPPVQTRPSYLARGYGIGTQFYNRPAITMRTLEGLFGRETVDRLFAAYFERWAFGHPNLEDFVASVRESVGDDVADYFVEAYSQTRMPDYRVDTFSTERWNAARGRLIHEDGVIEHDAEREDEWKLAGLDPAALEPDGAMTVEVLDPGSVRGDRWGRIERRVVAPEAGETEEEWEIVEDEFHESEVRVSGPGWDHLPVEIMFRFADGAVFREVWDGRAPYRGYRFLRAAPLAEVRIDPDGRIAMDPDPANNGRLREPDEALVRDWSAWAAGLIQLLAEGVSQWL